MNLKAKPWNFKYLSCPREGQLLPVSGGALGKSLTPLRNMEGPALSTWWGGWDNQRRWQRGERAWRSELEAGVCAGKPLGLRAALTKGESRHTCGGGVWIAAGGSS